MDEITQLVEELTAKLLEVAGQVTDAEFVAAALQKDASEFAEFEQQLRRLAGSGQGILTQLDRINGLRRSFEQVTDPALIIDVR